MMNNHEKSVLILDSKKRYKNTMMPKSNIKITSIERSHELGLKSVEKAKPDILVKVINEDERYTFSETIQFLSDVKRASDATRVLVVNGVMERARLFWMPYNRCRNTKYI